MATSSAAVTATKGPKLKVLPFDLHGDRLDLGKRWEKWFERFERDLEYNGCDPSKTPEIAKMALLIYAGTEVEDLHATLPEPGRPEGTEEENWTAYEQSKTKLKIHFSPKQCNDFAIFELLRMKIESSESITSYAMRLRKAASNVAPALLRQATYGTIKIGMYHGMKRIIVKNPKDEKFYYNIICGVVAGAVAAALCNPTDLLKVRMQAQSQGVAPSQGIFSSFAAIFREEGFSGLYRGVVPNAQRAAVIAGVELAIYDWCKKKILDNDLMEDNVYTHFLSSFTAGFAGAVASNPIDVVKTRLMNQRKLKHNEGGSQIYKSSLDCILTTLRTEGFFALYRGFIPNFVRLCPWNIVFFMSFEQYRKFGDRVL
ncbi:kidney mitochondrial carrier 1-like [Paramuricea clavata]|uniref:Kidney mitochondrial carrier 1-like n=1 Tax=Paramuricea clavata TaxID=317549 RepID=A0A7D9EVH5_PARCT|nr:kidney mitochondrial carrier 1-like [Paramuricea clavata]